MRIIYLSLIITSRHYDFSNNFQQSISWNKLMSSSDSIVSLFDYFGQLHALGTDRSVL